LSYELREPAQWEASALAVFSCSVRPRDFEIAVEESIRHHLADDVRTGTASVQTLGGWLDGELCGVAAWQPHPEIADAWFINVIAVATGHRNRGLGTLLKREIMDRARAEGIRVLVSVVHVDNDGMQRLNVALGGRPQTIPGDWTHRYWLVPVR
jgi:GNAT superfamily N-acetyltransferase